MGVAYVRRDARVGAPTRATKQDSLWMVRCGYRLCETVSWWLDAVGNPQRECTHSCGIDDQPTGKKANDR